MYTYITDRDLIDWSKVDDPEMNQLLQEARKLNPDLLIATCTILYKPGWFSRGKYETRYSIRFNDDNYQVRIVNFSGGGLNVYVRRESIINYLYGFITGAQLVKL